MNHSRPHRLAIEQAASSEQAAAIVAALARFMRATATPAATAIVPLEGWRRTALLEAVAREDPEGLPDPWTRTPG